MTSQSGKGCWQSGRLRWLNVKLHSRAEKHFRRSHLLLRPCSEQCVRRVSRPYVQWATHAMIAGAVTHTCTNAMAACRGGAGEASEATNTAKAARGMLERSISASSTALPHACARKKVRVMTLSLQKKGMLQAVSVCESQLLRKIREPRMQTGYATSCCFSSVECGLKAWVYVR